MKSVTLGARATHKSEAEKIFWRQNVFLVLRVPGTGRGDVACRAQQEKLLDEHGKVVNKRKSFQKHAQGLMGSQENTEGWRTQRWKHGLLSAHISKLRNV